MIFLPYTLASQAKPKDGAPREPPSSPERPGPKPPPPPPSPKNPGSIKKYRGNRTYSRQTPLTIKQTKCTRTQEGKVCVEIKFNQNINPRSLKNSSITVDGITLDAQKDISFSKKGDTIQFVVESEKNTLEIKVQEVLSFNGASLGIVKINAGVEDAK